MLSGSCLVAGTRYFNVRELVTMKTRVRFTPLGQLIMASSASVSDENYMKTMKMAIALACIRSKPEGMTAAEYTEQMCQNYLRRQQDCREKLKSAENEILQLKQQLVVQSALGQKKPLPSPTMADSQPCLTPPLSGVIAETVQTPVDSSQLIQHTAFLQSILNLQTVTRTPHLTSVTCSTIKNSLTMIKYCIENEANIPIVTVQKNVHVIMSVLDSEKILDLAPVVDDVLNIVSCILDKLLSKEHHTLEQAECLVMLITSFCHVRLFEKIVRIILTVIEDYSNHLRNIKQRKDKIDILKYWNLHFIFRILENIFYKHKQHTLIHSSDFVSMTNDRFDQTLLHLTDPFPLFAHAVWKLQGILNQFV